MLKMVSDQKSGVHEPMVKLILVDKEFAADGRQVTPMWKMLSDQKSEFMSN